MDIDDAIKRFETWAKGYEQGKTEGGCAESASEYRQIVEWLKELKAKRGSEWSSSMLQEEQRAWSMKNFGPHPWWHVFLGMVEEMGELSHAVLKQEQGIRKGEDLRAKEIDSVGDLVVYLADFCCCRGINLEQTIKDVWSEVKRRDWKKNPVDGKPTPKALETSPPDKPGTPGRFVEPA
jgi:NTP pyrophosphatase (non-canonical NTP hydrolase)